MPVAVSVFTGCNKKSPYDITVYYPLTVGNKWTYQDTFDMTNGNLWTEEITESYEWEGRIVYKIEQDSGHWPYWMVFVNDELRRYDEAPPASDYTILIQEPLEGGNEWFLSPSSSATLKIVDVNASVSVPAGRFDECLTVEAPRSWGPTTWWYAPNVGLVKKEWADPTYTHTVELIEFTVQ